MCRDNCEKPTWNFFGDANKNTKTCKIYVNLLPLWPCDFFSSLLVYLPCESIFGSYEQQVWQVNLRLKYVWGSDYNENKKQDKNAKLYLW